MAETVGTRIRRDTAFIQFVNSSVMARLIATAAARFGLRRVLIMSDDDHAPAALAEALPSHLEAATIVDGRANVTSSGRLTVHRIHGLEVGAFLLAALFSMARARVVVANSGSNLGNLMMSLAGVHTSFPSTPHIIDLDGTVTMDALFQGKYLCNLAPNRGTPANYGMCPSRAASESGRGNRTMTETVKAPADC